MKWLIRIPVILVALCLVALTAAIFWPATKPQASLASINSPFSSVDFSDLPRQQRMKMRDGVEIAFRFYKADAPKAIALLLHGSSAHGKSLHPLARALASRGIVAYAPDIRGHGKSSRRGDVDHIGQPSEDIADLLQQIGAANPGLPITLVGFSSGGGLALNAAGTGYVDVASRLLLLAPMLGPTAAPYVQRNKHRSKQKWAYPNIPRIVALSILNGFGIGALDHLPTIYYATGDVPDLTSSYSHRLLQSMNPQNASALLGKTTMPVTVLVGERDELFAAEAFEGAVRPSKPDAIVRVLPELNHIDLTLKPEAFDAIAKAILE